MDDYEMDEEFGLGGLAPEEEGEETANITTAASRGALMFGAPEIQSKYGEAVQKYEASTKQVLDQIAATRDRLLKQPTAQSKSEQLRGLAMALAAPRERDDPRFYERRNLYTFLRDIGEYGAAREKAEKEAVTKREAELAKLDELKSKYEQQAALGLLQQLGPAYRESMKPSASVKIEDEVPRLQNSRDQLIKQRSTLDPRDPNYLNLSKRIQELDKRIGYLVGEKGKDGEELSVGEKALDKKIGEEYANWVVGGGAVQSASRISRINDVVSKLGKKDNISGTIVGFTLENLPTVASALYPDAQDAKDVVESVVQTDLRAILGGQFAQKEGEALIKRAYNPRLSEEKNARRLKLLSLQMQMVSDEKNRAMNYFGDKGTIKGYTFRPFTANDFLTEDQLDRLDAGETPEQILGLSKTEIRPASDSKPAISRRKPVLDPMEEARKELARRREAQQRKGG